jgi:hypothetical protein
MGYNCLYIDVGVTVFRRSDDSLALKGVCRCFGSDCAPGVAPRGAFLE